jgi:hypothetical protein
MEAISTRTPVTAPARVALESCLVIRSALLNAKFLLDRDPKETKRRSQWHEPEKLITLAVSA